MSDPIAARRRRARALINAMKDDGNPWTAQKIINWLIGEYFMREETAERYLRDMVKAGWLKLDKKGLRYAPKS
jgi:DNA-binding IclR family transcriptional regulator